MELIRISQTKLKIMLDSADMKHFELDSGSCIDISGREAFRNILKEARDRCGFDAVDEKVFVQYYPDKGGGCEMFVTKLTDSRADGRGRGSTESGRHFAYSNGGAVERYDSGYIVYSFCTLTGLLSTCKMLNHTGYGGESLVYRMIDKRRYYLVLSEESYFAAENGGVRCESSYYYVILEHGELMCSDAVSKYAALG